MTNHARQFKAAPETRGSKVVWAATYHATIGAAIDAAVAWFHPAEDAVLPVAESVMARSRVELSERVGPFDYRPFQTIDYDAAKQVMLATQQAERAEAPAYFGFTETARGHDERAAARTARRAADTAADQTRRLEAQHDDFVNQIMQGACDCFDGDESGEDLAIRYVRHLESLAGNRACPPTRRALMLLPGQRPEGGTLMATKKQQEADSLRTAQLRRHAQNRAELAAKHKAESVALHEQHRRERAKLDELLAELPDRPQLSAVPDA